MISIMFLLLSYCFGEALATLRTTRLIFLCRWLPLVWMVGVFLADGFIQIPRQPTYYGIGVHSNVIIWESRSSSQ